MLKRLLYFSLLLLVVSLSMSASAAAQEAADESKSQDEASKIVTFTTREDHRNMLKQLGITKLRPGPSGNPSAPNSANYDESLANPYPNLPDVMTLKSGVKVTTPEMWWKQRRPEIVEDFEREVVGRIPKNVPDVTWELVNTEEKTLGKTVVIQKQLNGKVDNSACPEIEVNISMVVVTPKEAKGKVPVLMMFGFTGFEPWAERFRRRFGGRAFRRRPGAEPPKTQQLVERGWGFATISPGTIQADNGAGLTRGVIGLTNKGRPRKPEDWGALRAWAWGASRGLDYLETDKDVDARRVGIDGVSRYGKAALVTMAFDQRFAMVLVGSSGEGGASLYRRNFGEAVENITGFGEYHWMAGNFLKYGAAETSFGSKNASDLPVDAHQLIALCAPRLTFISYGVPERGDANWLDHQGSFMAAIAAQPVFRLLGAGGLGRSDDYKTEKMPAVNVGLLDGELAWRQHDGGHTDLPNIKHFVKWADRHFAAKKRPDPRAGVASRYVGDQGIAKDPAVVFTEDFEQSSLGRISERWDTVRNVAMMSLTGDVPRGSAGKQSLLISQLAEKGTGGDLYRRLGKGYDRLYTRMYVKFAEDCEPVHHFGTCVGGNNPATRWPMVRAGQPPKGDKSFWLGIEPYGKSWVWDYYTYWCDMRGSPPRGQTWGNSFIRDDTLKVRRGKWTCIEVMVRMNDVGDTNGELALWIDGKQVSHLGKGFPHGKWTFDKFHPGQEGDGVRWNHRKGGREYFQTARGGDPFEGFRFRTDRRLNVNFVWLYLYITKGTRGHANRVWFDDLVVAKDYIGPLRRE